MSDMNTKMKNENMSQMMSKWGMLGRNVNVEWVDFNTHTHLLSAQDDAYIYTWRRHARPNLYHTRIHTPSPPHYL